MLQLPNQEYACSSLEARPLLQDGNGIIVASPTSISIAIRRRVIDFVLDMVGCESFDNVYSYQIAQLVSETRLLGSESRIPIQWHSVQSHKFSSTSICFDAGHFLVLHFILPSIATYSVRAFKAPTEVPESLTLALEHAIGESGSQISEGAEFRRGLHLIVVCGWGNAFEIDVSVPRNHGWMHEVISLSDLVRLSDLGGMTIERFWRLKDALHCIEREGIHISNANGFINLLAWANDNNGRLIPHDQLLDGRISPDNPITLHIPTGLIRQIRYESDTYKDSHVAIDLRGQLHHLNRSNPEAIFKSPGETNLYACVDCVRKGRLVTLYEGAFELWVYLYTPHIQSRDTHYHLWKMINTWLPRACVAFESRGDFYGKYEVSVSFLDVESELEDTSIPASTPSEDSYQVAITSGNSAQITFKQGFMASFRAPENIAEREVARALIVTLAKFSSKSEGSALCGEVLDEIVPNPSGRSFHMFQGSSFTDYIQHTLPENVISVDEIDDAKVRTGLAWKAHNGDNRVHGKDECASLINNLVKIISSEIEFALGRFDRKSTITTLLLNYEKSISESNIWEKTSAAVLGLHGSSENVLRSIVQELSKNSHTQIISRCLAEMAISSCKLDNGLTASNLEIGELLAKTSLLIQMGSMSDGIFYGVLPSEITISSAGDLIFEDEFASNVVYPILREATGQRYVDRAPQQSANYFAPTFSDDTSHLFEPEFWEAWNVEMGFSIDEGREMVDIISSFAISRETAVLELKRSELKKLLESQFSEKAVSTFLCRLTSLPRRSWGQAPKGYRQKDIFPWRFGRRLSLVSRPMISIDNTTDPTMLVLPSLLKSGYIYLVNGAWRGTLDREFYETNEMRNLWWGKAREGHSFNAKVADQLRSYGWVAHENIKLSQILGRKMEKNYGDVDVLAYKEGSDTCLIIECKDLAFRRNYSEMAALISDYQGKIKAGKQDKLLKHLTRTDILSCELSSISKFSGSAISKLESCLVFSGAVPMQLSNMDALKGMFVGDLEALTRTYLDI